MAGADESTPLNQERENTVFYQTTDNAHSTTRGNTEDEENVPVPDGIASTRLPTGIWTVVTVLSVGTLPDTLGKVPSLTLEPGEFISNADGTLVIAAAGKIASEFNRLQDASWLSTAYTLGLCAAQPMVGTAHHGV